MAREDNRYSEALAEESQYLVANMLIIAMAEQLDCSHLTAISHFASWTLSNCKIASASARNPQARNDSVKKFPLQGGADFR